MTALSQPSPRSLAIRAAPAAASLVVGAALVTWMASLGDVDVRELDDLGLVSVLPAAAFAAVGAVVATFCILLRQQQLSRWALGFTLGALVLMLYGVSPLIEQIPRFAVSWRHAGIAEHLMTSGAVDPTIDAYFNWPGFFLVLAAVTRFVGIDNPVALAGWAPLFFGALILLPVAMIARAFTDDEAARWLAVAVFVLANWVGQDYLAPQAFSYFLALVVMAALLTWFRPDVAERDAGRRAAMAIVVLVLFAVTVASHQLTPFVTLVGASSIVLLRRCTARGLPVVMAVILASWLAFMAIAFLSGHFAELVRAIGDLTGQADANLGERLSGTDQHLTVVRTRLVFSGAVWAVAAVGFWWRRRRQHDDLAVAALVVAPFLLVPLQPYGGEMLLRVFLFSLPFAGAFVAALARGPSDSPPSVARTVALVAGSLVMLAGFLVARYGNERIEQFTRNDLTAVEHLYDVAVPGSLLIAATPNLPWQYTGYTDYRYSVLARTDVAARPEPGVHDVLAAADRSDRCAFVVLTRSQAADSDTRGLWRPGAVDRLAARLERSGRVEKVWSDGDGAVFAIEGGADAGCHR